MEGTLWARAADVYGPVIRDYHAARGGDPASAQVASTVRTNTELVPRRGDLLLRLLGEAGIPIEGRRVLDLGCGFGALSSYLAWRGGVRELVATDIREDFVAAAAAGADAMGLGDRLRVVVADMQDLSAVGGGFDVVIANNSMLYLRTRAALRAALAETRRASAPGAGLLVYQANRWRWREPFSKDPIVHLLPPRVAHPVSRVTGWRHNHNRVRLPSPLELRRRVRRAGYGDVRVVGMGAEGARRWFTTFYALTARAPGV